MILWVGDLVCAKKGGSSAGLGCGYWCACSHQVVQLGPDCPKWLQSHVWRMVLAISRVSLSTWPLSLRRVAWLLHSVVSERQENENQSYKVSCGLGPELLKYYYHILLGKARHKVSSYYGGREINCTSWEKSSKDRLQRRVHTELKEISKRNSFFSPMYHIKLAHIPYPLIVIVLSKFYCHMKLNLTPLMLVLLHIMCDTYRQPNHSTSVDLFSWCAWELSGSFKKKSLPPTA